jgi:hypothetical protein
MSCSERWVGIWSVLEWSASVFICFAALRASCCSSFCFYSHRFHESTSSLEHSKRWMLVYSSSFSYTTFVVESTTFFASRSRSWCLLWRSACGFAPVAAAPRNSRHRSDARLRYDFANLHLHLPIALHTQYIRRHFSALFLETARFKHYCSAATADERPASP